MASKKKCFVISPIGDENSEIRKESDALLWVTRSALEKFDFEVIRVDQIARSTTITNEIIQLIQESELCLIVLTGHNPNVFYEAGRRHETGRPFIQLIRKGESLPFDVASIRTIIYDDIQSLPSAAKVVEQIQKFIQEYEKSGYGASGTGVSMSTIAAALDRIERKVGQVLSGTGSAPTISAGDMMGAGFTPNLKEGYMSAIAAGNLQRAASLLPRLEKLLGPSGELIAAAAFLSMQGYEPAVEIIYGVLSNNLDQIKKEGVEVLQAGVGSLVQFYNGTNRSDEGVSRCEPLFMRIIEFPEVSNEQKANILNQWQMLLYGAKRYQEALTVCEQVLDLDKNSQFLSAYVLNTATVYEALGLKQKGLEMVERYMKMSNLAPKHYSHAVEVYLEANRIDDAKNAFAKLREVDPSAATLLLFNTDIAKQLGIRL